MNPLTPIRAAVLTLFAFFTMTALVSTANAARTPATLKVNVAPKVVSIGNTVKVRGNSGLTGQKTVSLLFRDAGTTSFDHLKKVTTDDSGFYSTGVAAKNSGGFKVLTPSGAESPLRKIKVRSSLKIGSVHKYVKLGDKLGIRGVVRPAGVRRIKIVIKGAGETIRTKTKKHGGFSASWRPKASGTYKVRVFSAGNSIAIGDKSRRIKVYGLRPSGASYYGPGLYGNGVACGGTLTPSTIGVANKTLPCGTKVTIRYHGRTVVAPVIDRGPYVAGRDYDLTEAVRNKLGFGGVGTVWTNH
jgi:3D (Asp-Asp-Asp) domain-containing protein